jgi:hypothetical protein
VTAFTGANPIADFDDNGIFDLADIVVVHQRVRRGLPVTERL